MEKFRTFLKLLTIVKVKLFVASSGFSIVLFLFILFFFIFQCILQLCSLNNFYDTSCVERDPKSKESISNEIKRNRLSEGYAEKYKDDAQRGHKIAAECDGAAARCGSEERGRQ